MKFRCTKNSLRLRLRRSDVEALHKEGQVQEKIAFGPNSQLLIVLKSDVEVESVAADLSANTISIRLPESESGQWIQSDAVSLEGSQPDGAGGRLRILVEKDLSCKGRNQEDKADFFEELGEKDC